MTQAEVQKVIEQFAARGLRLHEWAAVNFLGARELLARDPSHKLAAEVVQHYLNFLATEVESCCFAVFMLPEFWTAEEIAERERAQAVRA